MCHESCPDNGSVVEAAAGWAGKCHVVRSRGGLLRQRIGDPVTVEDVARNWGKVVDMSRAERVESIGVRIFSGFALWRWIPFSGILSLLWLH